MSAALPWRLGSKSYTRPCRVFIYASKPCRYAVCTYLNTTNRKSLKPAFSVHSTFNNSIDPENSYPSVGAPTCMHCLHQTEGYIHTEYISFSLAICRLGYGGSQSRKLIQEDPHNTINPITKRSTPHKKESCRSTTGNIKQF